MELTFMRHFTNLASLDTMYHCDTLAISLQTKAKCLTSIPKRRPVAYSKMPAVMEVLSFQNTHEKKCVKETLIITTF